MAKLSKSFETSENNSLDIRADYDPRFDEVESMSVWVYNQKKQVFTDLTEIFEQVSELVNLVDNIDWREIYQDEMAERADDRLLNF